MAALGWIVVVVALAIVLISGYYAWARRSELKGFVFAFCFEESKFERTVIEAFLNEAFEDEIKSRGAECHVLSLEDFNTLQRGVVLPIQHVMDILLVVQLNSKELADHGRKYATHYIYEGQYALYNKYGTKKAQESFTLRLRSSPYKHFQRDLKSQIKQLVDGLEITRANYPK